MMTVASRARTTMRSASKSVRKLFSATNRKDGAAQCVGAEIMVRRETLTLGDASTVYSAQFEQLERLERTMDETYVFFGGRSAVHLEEKAVRKCDPLIGELKELIVEERLALSARNTNALLAWKRRAQLHAERAQ